MTLTPLDLHVGVLRRATRRPMPRVARRSISFDALADLKESLGGVGSITAKGGSFQYEAIGSTATAIIEAHGLPEPDFNPPTPQFDTIEQWLGRIIPDNDDLGQRAGHVRRRAFKTRGLQRKEMTETGLRGVDKRTHPFEFKHSLVSRDEIAAKFGKLFLAKLILGKTMPIVWNVNPDERPDFRPLQRAFARVGMSLLTVAEFKATL